MDKLRQTEIHPSVQRDPIDSASAHWNSEASVVVRKSRRCNEKALLPYRFLSRVQGPKVRQSNLRNTVVTAGAGKGARKRDIRSLRDWELLDALRIRILGLGNCARIKSKGYRGLLFHCALRSVPRKVMQSARVLSVMCRLLARPLVNTLARTRKRNR